jgi:hypothetical protein
LNLEELKHGILRGNKKAPNAYMRSLGANDPRALLIKDVIFFFIVKIYQIVE